MKELDKFRNISYKQRDHCVICGKDYGDPLFKLPGLPITEVYTRRLIKEKLGYLDQEFHYCVNCRHGQIANVIDINLQYGNTDNYHFRTSASANAKDHTEYFIEFFRRHTKGRHFGSIVEIGCNDLYLLDCLRPKAKRLIGIDPLLKGREKECSDRQLTVIGDFFENVLLKDKIDVVICKDTLEHIDEPKLMVEKVINMASEETLFFFQFPLLDVLLLGGRFDQIYHQHLNYFSLESIIYMLNELKCQLLDYTINFNHFGSIIIVFKRNKKANNRDIVIRNYTPVEILDKYLIFKNSMELINKRLKGYKNETIYGYGAALMLPILSYYLKNDLSCLKCVIDDDRNKAGWHYLNLPVSIKPLAQIADISNSIVLVTAISSINNVRKILPKLFKLNPRQVILPLNTI